MGNQAKPAGRVVVGFGVLMIVLGVVAYFLTDRSSVTALIPSFFGVALVGCGAAAAAIGRVAMIVAIVLGVLGVAGPLGRVVPATMKDGFTFDTATVVQLIFAALSALLVLILIKLKAWKG